MRRLDFALSAFGLGLLAAYAVAAGFVRIALISMGVI